MAKQGCKAKTKAGKRCRNAAVEGDVCLAHASRKEKESRGFGGPQPGSGRPRTPRTVEVLRELCEVEAERLLKPYTDALEATDAEGHPDHRTRIWAAERIFDRAHGRPRVIAEIEVSGGETWHVGRLSDREMAALQQLVAKVTGDE